MKLSKINNHIEYEKNQGILISSELLNENFVLKDPLALYPEYKDVLKIPYGLHRPGVNLAALLFLYQHVIVYVPPMIRSDFKHRFGIDYDTFMLLAYPADTKDRFIFPIINHPRKYKNKLFFYELYEILDKTPPTWERWHSALYHTGGNIWFDEADKRFDYKKIWKIPDLREYWSKKLATTSQSYLSKEIKQQIRNNYTDLCLVGKKDLANEIAEMSKNNPELAINDLLYSSDLFAYSSIMGAGGYANVRDYEEIPLMSDILKQKLVNWIPEIKHFDTKNFETMFEGLNFHKIPDNIRIDFLLEWHRSNNASLARSAYASLLEIAQKRNPSLNELHDTLTTIIGELDEFCRNAEPEEKAAIKKADKFNNKVVKISLFGSLASTLGGLFINDILWALSGGFFTIIGAKPWKNRDKIINHLLHRHLPQIPKELFINYKNLKDSRDEIILKLFDKSKNVNEIVDKSVYSSKNVRSVWWEK